MKATEDEMKKIIEELWGSGDTADNVVLTALNNGLNGQASINELKHASQYIYYKISSKRFKENCWSGILRFITCPCWCPVDLCSGALAP